MRLSDFFSKPLNPITRMFSQLKMFNTFYTHGRARGNVYDVGCGYTSRVVYIIYIIYIYIYVYII